MTDQYPITPPPELVQQWINEEDGLTAGHIATQAANWGSDQELEACCEWFQELYKSGDVLRAARRPEPSSLKELALAALKDLNLSLDDGHNASTIRKALEALPND